MINLLLSGTAQGLLWAIMGIGVFITFRILDSADLSAEGTFALGGSVTALAISQQIHPLLATVLGLCAGALAGLITGLLHTLMKIPPLLAGIITLTGLYSINLFILGKSNLSIVKMTTLISFFQQLGMTKTESVLVMGSIALIAVILSLVVLFKTEIGLALCATGDNPHMSQANGIRINWMKCLAYMLSNGLIALSGALFAQNNGYADVNMGVGTIVFGLSAIILSEVMFSQLSLPKRFMAISLGAVLYRFILMIILQFNIDPQMIKLFSAILLAIILYIPQVRQRLGVRHNTTLKGGR
ncbi:ABC transporter permease [Carnobacteriaceae bacterium zg-ZUI252]|nr:ABC transporter permease [Carnobacteriaceae bacterium zg-ZUI252]QTU83040.1 ABC transporter permease [Carnobacteriaceae bacterium zg-C25]